MLSLPTWMAGASVMTIGVAVAASCWAYIRSLMYKLINLVIIEAEVKYTASPAVQSYCWNRLRRLRLGCRRFEGSNLYVRSSNDFQCVGAESLGTDSTIFWKGWAPILIRWVTSKDGAERDVIHLSTIRGMVDLEQLIGEAIAYFNSRQQQRNGEDRKVSRFSITKFCARPREQEGIKASTTSYANAPQGYSEDTVRLGLLRVFTHDPEDIGVLNMPGQALEQLVIPKPVRQAVRHARHWLGSRAFYEDRGIPWTTGILFYGGPGTGKTSVIRAMASDLGLPLFAFDLAGMTNSMFLGYWQEMQARTPCMAVIEDIDTIFNKRVNMTAESTSNLVPLTFDCLLNAFSGIQSCSGVLKVVTTNRLEMLDEALGVPTGKPGGSNISTRPGRLDLAVELPSTMDIEGRFQLAERICSDCQDRIESLVFAGEHDTPAQFEYRCCQAALDAHWAAPAVALSA